MLPPSPIFTRYCFFVLALTLLMCCGTSDQSTGPLTDPAQLQVNVVVHRRVFEDGSSSHFIKGYVKDAMGKTIANPAIQLRVNGQALQLNGGSTNYYGAFPYYELVTKSDTVIQSNKMYTFTVVMTDGTEHLLGRIETLADLDASHLALPAAHSRSQPLLLRWRDIESGNSWLSFWKRWQSETSYNELLVSKISERKDKWGHRVKEDGSSNQADYITLIIGSGGGSHMIPLSYFEGPQTRFNALSLMLNSTKTVDVSRPFIKGSSLSSERTRLYRIELVE